jgi:hypothetical protein
VADVADEFEAKASQRDERDPHVRITRLKGGARRSQTPERGRGPKPHGRSRPTKARPAPRHAR